MAHCRIPLGIYRSSRGSDGSFFLRSLWWERRLILPKHHYKSSLVVSLDLIELVFNFILFVVDEIYVRWMTSGEPTSCFGCPIIELENHTAKDGFYAILRLFC